MVMQPVIELNSNVIISINVVVTWRNNEYNTDVQTDAPTGHLLTTNEAGILQNLVFLLLFAPQIGKSVDDDTEN